MRFRKPQEDDVRLGIAPLIDIVFLLLIFFMVTSHFDVSSGVRIQLPKVARKVFHDDTRRSVLVIDRSGKVYLKGKPVPDKSLKNVLRHLVREKKILQVVLQADKDVKHGKVVEIIDTAKSAGVRSVMIAAQWKSGKVL
jgi:biopolymer transport protein ExbD